MPQILKGAPVAAAIRDACVLRVERKKSGGTRPTLCILRVGSRPEDVFYENSAVKKCRRVGIDVIARQLPKSVSTEEVRRQITAINQEEGIHGLLMLRPLPEHLDEQAIKETLAPEKDVDCMLDGSLFLTMKGEEGGFLPCTAKAVIRLLEHYGVEIAGREAVVIGRSMVVGKPLAMMLLKRNATVTVCHSKTVDLPKVCRRGDILICAAGAAKMIGASCIKPGAVVVDVGINQDAEGGIVGDVDFDDASRVTGAITPVPGGIGTVTSWILLEHVVDAWESQLRKKTGE